MQGVRIKDSEGKEHILECDSVLVLKPQKPAMDLAESIRKNAPEMHVMGSALGADNGFFKHALYDGRKTGCML